MEPERKLHVVDEPEVPKMHADGLTSHFVHRTQDGELRWLPFPGLEKCGAEIRMRHQSCKHYAKWQKGMESAARSRGGRATTDSDVFRAKLPAAYAEIIVADWRTPKLDDEGQETGAYHAGIPWGPGPTTIDAMVYTPRGKGAVMEAKKLAFDVDAEGYLRSTLENREKLFAAFPAVLDEVVGLAMDDEVFARPDEEAIRGN